MMPTLFSCTEEELVCFLTLEAVAILPFLFTYAYGIIAVKVGG